MTLPSPAHLRRSPSQQRSRDRVERILDAAAAIVEDEVLDALKVIDIAKRAGVPLGTLYQFFARKDDIVYALAERFAQRFADVLESSLAGLDTDCEWHELLDLLLDAYTAYYRNEPALRELWSGRGSIRSSSAQTTSTTTPDSRTPSQTRWPARRRSRVASCRR
ncbi:MAG: TetR/AcrR family transcriptional regulator [Mycobacterium sp.]|nr:TetR/AcrR family transcriptional regulator [Mycobacterium sp.]